MKYDEFISRVRRRARLASNEEAGNAARATLETFAERLKGNEIEHLAAQLPPELAQCMQSSTSGMGDNFSLDEFFNRVSAREGTAIADAEFHARVVLGLVAETVTVGEIDDVRAQLPPEFARLLEVENEGDIPELGNVSEIEEENA